MKVLDMQGQPCPIPVVNAKKALAESGCDGVIVTVDNFVAVQNLEKMAKGEGHTLSYTQDGESLYKVTVTKNGEHTGLSPAVKDSLQQHAGEGGGAPLTGTVVLITANSMGRGADDLGKLLIKGFIFSLTQLKPLPQAVIFLNSGAELTTEGANTVPDLKVLQEHGTQIYTCGTCANYYKLTDALAVGTIVDMMKITNTLTLAKNIITI
ncbi:MAG: sulfurtransferase-like selenium metabolism protein YedF [Termitinemataceae bacterium]|nr:MAG: sulfurtransferase-like selenium metabolism protein YedF [Termitinemataceae bacterium]